MNEYDGNDPHDVATHTSLTTAMSLNIDVYSESSSMFDNNSSTMSVDAHTVEPGHLHLSSTVRLYDISGENIVNISNFIHGRVQMAGTSKMLSALSYFKIWKKSPEQLLYHDQEQEEGFVLRDLKPVNGCLRLGHEYHINPKLLGAGTFGRVYSATQLNSTDKKFVLKVVPVERFREEEIKFAHMYPHEHLYKPYGMTWKKNTVHFFCELIQGGTLEHLVERTGPLRDDEVLYVLKTLLQYLEYWHCFGVVHRDIKPSNIMVSNDGSFLKVIDCGASGQLIDSQERTSLHGTECYMSPEMCRQEGHNEMTDIWSTGCVGLFMNLGQPPFHREIQSNLYGTLLYYVGMYPEEINKYVDEVQDDDLRSLISKMLRVKDQRFSAKNLLREELMGRDFPHKLTMAVDRTCVNETIAIENDDVADDYNYEEEDQDSLRFNAMHARIASGHGNLPNIEVLETMEGAVGGTTKTCDRETTKDSGLDDDVDDVDYDNNDDDAEEKEDETMNLAAEEQPSTERKEDELEERRNLEEYQYTLDNYISKK